MAEIQDRFITNLDELSASSRGVVEANAKSQGITPQEYLKQRGGIESTTRTYGDSYNPKEDLTAAEYNAVLEDVEARGLKGEAIGQAINAATAKKRGKTLYDYTGGFQGIKPDTAGKVVQSSKKNPDGTSTVTYTDGTSGIIPAGAPVPVVGSTTARTAATGTPVTDTQTAERQSAYDLLYLEFQKYGLQSLVEPLKGLITSGASPAEFTIELRKSPAYQARFAANAERIKKGLKAINEAEYLDLEDQYQSIMRNYGLPESYYARGDMGAQPGFNQFIANDVSALELEDRIATAQKRVLNANPEVLQAIRDFYGDSITNGDILAYTLNPTKGLEDIKRKVTAAEIGGAAVQAGLNLGRTAEEKALYAARAGELGAAGITKAQAQQGFQTVAEVAPRGGQLAEIYKQSPYTQQTAEAEVFGLAGSAEAARQRKKLTSLETAAFGGSAGAGAIARDRAGVL
jgi:hypothetical protein